MIAVADGGLSFSSSALAVLVAAAAEGIAFVVQKPLLEHYSPLEFMAYAMWLATVMIPAAPVTVGDLENASSAQVGCSVPRANTDRARIRLVGCRAEMHACYTRSELPLFAARRRHPHCLAVAGRVPSALGPVRRRARHGRSNDREPLDSFSGIVAQRHRAGGQ